MRRVVLLVGNVPLREVLENLLGPEVEIRELAQDLDAPRPLLAGGPPEIIDVSRGPQGDVLQHFAPISDVLIRKVSRLVPHDELDLPTLLPAIEYPHPRPSWPVCRWAIPRCAPRTVSPLHFWAAALRSWSHEESDDLIRWLILEEDLHEQAQAQRPQHEALPPHPRRLR